MLSSQWGLGRGLLASQILPIEQEDAGTDNQQHARGFVDTRYISPEKIAAGHGGPQHMISLSLDSIPNLSTSPAFKKALWMNRNQSPVALDNRMDWPPFRELPLKI